MTRLERRLRDALREARARLSRGDIHGAGLELDAACAACAQAGKGARVTRSSDLIDLVRACQAAVEAHDRAMRTSMQAAISGEASRRTRDDK